MVVQAKPLQTLIRLRVIDQDKQGIVQMLSFGVFAKGGDLHNPFKVRIGQKKSGGFIFAKIWPNFWSIFLLPHRPKQILFSNFPIAPQAKQIYIFFHFSITPQAKTKHTFCFIISAS